MEAGESIEETARRKMREEAGIDVERLTLCGVNGDEVYNLTAVFVATDPVSEPQTDGQEGSEVRSFAPGALPTELSPPSDQYVRQFVAELAVG